MAKGKKTVGFKADGSQQEDIEQYKTRNGLGSTSEALEDLVEMGLREARGPILYRIKQQAIDAAFYLGLVALVTIIIGFTTSNLTPGNAIEIALVMVAIGMMPIAILELVRYGRGQSTLRNRVRGDNS